MTKQLELSPIFKNRAGQMTAEPIIRIGMVSIVALALGIGALSKPAHSVLINSSFTGFNAAQQAATGLAVSQWQGILGGEEAINVNFIADAAAGLANTSNWVYNAAGRPTSADVRVNLGQYNWTVGAPAAGVRDGARGMAHELGHALGFTANAASFAANIRTAGANRYYDIDNNNAFSAIQDFDLNDPGDGSSGTHARPNAVTDLMQPFAPVGVRLTPEIQHAAVLTDAFDYGRALFFGADGYGNTVMSRNDDGSSAELPLPFAIDFFGNNFNTMYVNNNGNITFGDDLGGYTPVPFPVTNQPMIAPFWGDVDTRCGSCGQVFVHSPNADTVAITWDDVGFYSADSSKTNKFQAVLRNRADVAPGDFDIEFRYDDLNWTTGDASGGTNGLGGTPAQAGFDAGDGTNFLTVPGSRTAAVLNLVNQTNLTPNIPGIFSYAIRSGSLPGATPNNPLLPVVANNGWNFNFPFNNMPVWIDPEVAIGYDYVVDVGANFASVILPTGIGDDLYDLFLFDLILGDFLDSGFDIAGGVEFDFVSNIDAAGLNRFRILGIEIAAALDPSDTLAFVTGLTFVAPGNIQMRQIPIALTIGATVPEPGTVLLFLPALVVLSRMRKKQTKSVN